MFVTSIEEIKFTGMDTHADTIIIQGLIRLYTIFSNW